MYAHIVHVMRMYFFLFRFPPRSAFPEVYTHIRRKKILGRFPVFPPRFFRVCTQLLNSIPYLGARGVVDVYKIYLAP